MMDLKCKEKNSMIEKIGKIRGPLPEFQKVSTKREEKATEEDFPQLEAFLALPLVPCPGG